MAADRHALITLCAAVPLIWPAAWNGYPTVFADTGTYLSQAVHLYLGWDRPPFYSLFMLPLHLTLTTWPVVGVQAIVAAWVLGTVLRVLVPGASSWWLLAATVTLSLATWLPWLVSELMPDLFTPLLVLALGLLALAPERLEPRERIGLVVVAAFAIAAQLSSLPLYLALAAVLALGRRIARPALALAPLGLAVAALLAVNLAGHGRFGLAPYGSIFLLARLVDDGPASATLHRDCPAAGWRLCAVADRLPMKSDTFLWDPASPVLAVGGHKAVAEEARSILAATLRADPWGVLRAGATNTWRQASLFASGDGLEPWPAQVSDWITQDFPPYETARYAAARQQHGLLSVPPWMARLHAAVALAGVVLSLSLLVGPARRWPLAAWFLALGLMALPVSAAVTGALSGPHDRYQARIMWLPAFLGAAVLAGRWR